ncbi:MAG: hypothetical protein QNJ34_10530 [Xenococcaceae cyanobacterium MO_188.B29]|nr:hypothetical protein [Xenococcaceae cyanobacterium MO_188.B29]
MANLKGNEASLVKYKPKWQSGKTQTIRVPMAIANLVLEGAREIDTNGNQSLLEVINSQKEYITNLSNKLSTLEQELSEKNEAISNRVIQLKTVSQVIEKS